MAESAALSDICNSSLWLHVRCLAYSATGRLQFLGVTDPCDYKWSSYNAHLTGKDNKLVKVGPLLQIVHSWKEFVEMPALEVEAESIRMHERTGRPLGNDLFREVTGNNIPILHRIFVRIQGVIMKEYWNIPSLSQRRIRAKRQVRCVYYFL